MNKNEYEPTYMTPPGESLAEILDALGMSQAELADRMGRPNKTVNEIIKGKTAITPETAIQLERVLGTPASFWNNRERNYREWLVLQEERKKLNQHLPWMKKFPIRGMINLGWIEEYGDPLNQLEELLRFFGVASPVQWQKILQKTQVAYRQSPAFAVDPAAISAWLRKGEIESQQIECLPYIEKNFQDALNKARCLTIEPPSIFVHELTRMFAQVGVAVVFVPELPGTRTSGATRWLSPEKAMIMLSLRYKTDDHLWFTFFHEAAHILLHGKRDIFLEDGNKHDGDVLEKEIEANNFASEFLIPAKELENFYPRGSRYSHEDIIAFAQRLGITPGIVVGRLQHDGLLDKSNCNHLKRQLIWESHI